MSRGPAAAISRRRAPAGARAISPRELLLGCVARWRADVRPEEPRTRRAVASGSPSGSSRRRTPAAVRRVADRAARPTRDLPRGWQGPAGRADPRHAQLLEPLADRKSTRLNSSHVSISYAVFCLKKKKKKKKKKSLHTISDDLSESYHYT